MHIWIGLAVFATFLWASTNHIDKYLLSKMFKGSGIGTLMMFSTIVTGVVMSPVFFIITKGNINIDIASIIWIYGASLFGVIGLYMYFIALEKDDASTVIAVFQTIPVFSYFLGLIFLKEVLNLKQIVACIIIILSATFIIIDFREENKSKSEDELKALIFMLIASFSYAMSFFLFKFVAQNTTFYVTAFWEQIAFLINGILLLLFIKKYREGFIVDVKRNGATILSLNLLNEILNCIAKVIYNFVSMSLPLAILWSLNGLQPFFVFLIGLGLTVLCPKIACERIDKETLIKKILCILFSVVGLLMLYF